MKNQPIDQTYLDAALSAAATRTYRLAARLGLPSADREDLQQELLLDLLERAPGFDPQRACANTFTGVVSQHRAVELLDALMKDRARMCLFSGGSEAANYSQMGEPDQYLDDNVVPMWADETDLVADHMALLDLDKARKYMSDEQIEFFDLLDAHLDLSSACKASGVSSATFYRRVNEMQMHLRMFGFKLAA
jgi:DNA-directed RNA polymerase specialized sigma24 family protein